MRFVEPRRIDFGLFRIFGAELALKGTLMLPNSWLLRYQIDVDLIIQIAAFLFSNNIE